MTLGNTPGAGGIIVIVGACLAVASIMTLVTGEYGLWPFILAGILAGWWAVQSINK